MLKKNINRTLTSSGAIGSWVSATGTADAIVVTYNPPIATLTDGLLIFFRSAYANATTTPTVNVNGLGAKTLTKQGGSAVAAGDIPAALYECIAVYNLANTRFELLNPASSSASTTSEFINHEIFGGA